MVFSQVHTRHLKTLLLLKELEKELYPDQL